jgi:outer membrane protein assembly factor BamD
MTLSFPRAVCVAFVTFLSACASDPSDLPPVNPLRPDDVRQRELRLEAEELYKLARRSLDSSDFAGAQQRYSQILLRFPFTDIATQAQLESIYAKYRSFDPDGALSTADRFLKEHPRHEAGDYVYYLKGLINFQRGDTLFDWAVDSSRQDVNYARRAFDDFSLLTQRYPNSRYAADARLRMIYLRNEIAEHEMHVVRYYVRRGAHIAAAKRAERIVTEYPGAPATLEALAVLEDSYREMGLNAQAEDIKRVRAANPAANPKENPAANPAPATNSGLNDEFELQPGAVTREIGQLPPRPSDLPESPAPEKPQAN